MTYSELSETIYRMAMRFRYAPLLDYAGLCPSYVPAIDAKMYMVVRRIYSAYRIIYNHTYVYEETRKEILRALRIRQPNGRIGVAYAINHNHRGLLEMKRPYVGPDYLLYCRAWTKEYPCVQPLQDLPMWALARNLQHTCRQAPNYDKETWAHIWRIIRILRETKHSPLLPGFAAILNAPKMCYWLARSTPYLVQGDVGPYIIGEGANERGKLAELDGRRSSRILLIGDHTLSRISGIGLDEAAAACAVSTMNQTY